MRVIGPETISTAAPEKASPDGQAERERRGERKGVWRREPRRGEGDLSHTQPGASGEREDPTGGGLGVKRA